MHTNLHLWIYVNTDSDLCSCTVGYGRKSFLCFTKHERFVQVDNILSYTVHFDVKFDWTPHRNCVVACLSDHMIYVVM